MFDMRKGDQEPYQYNTPRMSVAPQEHSTTHPRPQNDGTAGTSNDKGKFAAENPPSSSSSDDDEAQANSDLLNAWMQRLQVLTIATAFLAGMDGELFSLTTLNTQIGRSVSSPARELVYACLAGALIFHICASVLGYTASFALIRYRIVDASGEDGMTKVGGILFFSLGATQPGQRLSRRIVLERVRPLNWLASYLQRPETPQLLSAFCRSSSPSPPLSLLTRCYYTTLSLAAVGFVLAVTGILVYVWAGLRMPVGIFATVCLGVAVSAGVWAIAT